MERERRGYQNRLLLVCGAGVLGVAALAVAVVASLQTSETKPGAVSALSSASSSPGALRFKPSQRPVMATPSYSEEVYLKDPARYLSDVVPGRAFQVLSAAPGLAGIQPASPLSPVVKALESVQLAVKVPNGAPVTFTSVGLGAFPNGQASVTVAAAADGVASTRFTATRGTLGRAMVFVASPRASGQVRFVVEIHKGKGT